MLVFVCSLFQRVFLLHCFQIWTELALVIRISAWFQEFFFLPMFLRCLIQILDLKSASINFGLRGSRGQLTHALQVRSEYYQWLLMFCFWLVFSFFLFRFFVDLFFGEDRYSVVEWVIVKKSVHGILHQPLFDYSFCLSI